MLPPLVAFFSLVSWIIILRKKNIKKLNDRFIATFIIVLFLIHPNITSKMINMMYCKEYDMEERMKMDLQVKCREGYQLIVTVFIALPLLLLWGIGIPSGALYLMWKQKDRLDTISVKEKFGFLFNGFKT